MRAVVQRVTSARVRVGDRVIGEIGRGLLVLRGRRPRRHDRRREVLAGKIRDLRVFEATTASRWIAPWSTSAAAVLVVSQFTLYGDVRKGRRPSFDGRAARDARGLYEELVRELRAAHVPVATGEFQAMMQVELVNDGPVTILIDSDATVLSDGLTTPSRPPTHDTFARAGLFCLPAASLRAAAAARDRGSRRRSAPAACSSRRLRLRARASNTRCRVSKGNLLRLPLIGVSIGISSIAEIQIDGGFYNRLTITERNDGAAVATW